MVRTYDYIEKPCASCKEVKPLTEFNRMWKMVDGRSWRCRECAKKTKRDGSKYAERRKEIDKRHLEFGRDPKYGNTWELLHGALKTIERVGA